MERLKTYEERLADVNRGFKLTLAVEERFTNLRIWTGSSKTKAEGGVVDTVYMRLDKFKAYSAPLNEQSYGYLNNKSPIIYSLLRFGFSSPIENLKDILTITMPLKQRDLKDW